MSYNPVRAANFYKNRGKGVRHQPNPHAGTKHSDIVRRQGLGITVPLSARTATPSGFASTLMTTDKFVVRSEIIGAGNHLGLGCNPKQDRMLIVRVGSLFVQINDEDLPKNVVGATQTSTFHRLQAGSHLCLTKGTVYRIAASGTEDSEVLFIEEPGYEKSFDYYERPETRGLDEQSTLTANTPDAVMLPARRQDQTVAKTQAVQAAQVVRRRRGKGAGGGVSPGLTAETGRGGSVNPNSANVVGISPRPMGATAFSSED